MRTPEEMMSIKCIFIPLLALALPGNWVSSCSWVAHLDEAASMTLVDVCFMLQGVWKQTGSDPRRLEYLEWRERLWASFVNITLHLRAILISFGIDSIQIRHQNIFSTEGGDTLEKDLPVLPRKSFIQRTQQIQQSCTSGRWCLQMLPCITALWGGTERRLHRAAVQEQQHTGGSRRQHTKPHWTVFFCKTSWALRDLEPGKFCCLVVGT